jgi:tetratricopeptide (TPR) repeat protein/tRNA A-37 threonylcarbamoyl transferase component Bud32
MGCPAVDEIAAFVHGGEGAAHTHVEAHVAECADCRELVAELARSLPPAADAGEATIPGHRRSPATPGPTDVGRAPTERPLPRRIGRYEISGILGAGGMGVVYAAYDPQLGRKLAIKLLRPELSRIDAVAQESRTRLLREAQAMARLAHPNAIAIYDAGTAGGQVFIAMELAVGTTLAGWLAQARRTPRQVLAMFRQAGRGLQAAHAAGLVHRDFKPDNVLVDKAGRVKVTDFGLARPATDSELGKREPQPGPLAVRHDGAIAAPTATVTRTDAVVGTPAYMAPEQHEGRRADARSDQYAYCVSLWEALAGERPFSGHGAADLFAQKLAGRPQEPRGKALPSRAKKVLLRGLAVDPASRFPSMDALLDALAPSTSLPARIAIAAAAGLLLVLGGVALARKTQPAPARSETPCGGIVGQLFGIGDPMTLAEVQAAFSASGTSFSAAAWSESRAAVHTWSRRYLSEATAICAAHQRGELSSQRYDLRQRCYERARDEASATLALLKRGERELLGRSRQLVANLPRLSDCSDEAQLDAPIPWPSDEGLRARIVAGQRELAEVRALRKAGRWDVAAARARAATDDAQKIGWRPLEAEALYQLGYALERSGDSPAAEVALRRAVLAAEAGRADDLAARSRIMLVYTVGYSQDRFGEARQLDAAAKAAVERLGERPDLESHRVGTLAMVAHHEAKLEEGERLCRRALELLDSAPEPDPSARAQLHTTLALILEDLGRFDEAKTLHLEAYEENRETLGEWHPDTARSAESVATVHWVRDDLKQAQAWFERAYRIRREVLPPDHPDLAFSQNNLALVYFDQGDLPRAVEGFAAAVAFWSRRAPGRELARAEMNLGNTERELGHLAEATRLHQASYDHFQKVLGPDHLELAMVALELAEDYGRGGRADAALAMAKTCTRLITQHLGAEAPDLAWCFEAEARALVDSGRARLALARLEQAKKIAAIAPKDSLSPEVHGALAFTTARALYASGARARARALAQQARDAYGPAPRLKSEVQKVDTWLASHGP